MSKLKHSYREVNTKKNKNINRHSHESGNPEKLAKKDWIPASAGMTDGINIFGEKLKQYLKHNPRKNRFIQGLILLFSLFTVYCL
ncbi:MAG: hypothetical protein AAB228_01530, partial [Nitrospirota bacterium]